MYTMEKPTEIGDKINIYIYMDKSFTPQCTVSPNLKKMENFPCQAGWFVNIFKRIIQSEVLDTAGYRKMLIA